MTGRPPIYSDPKDMERDIELYFEKIRGISEETGEPYWKRPPTMTGLAAALDMDRTSLVNYSHKEPFFDTIKKAKRIVEEFTEEKLHGRHQVAGVIFSLKNNFASWEDRTKVDATHDTHKSLLSKLAEEDKAEAKDE